MTDIIRDILDEMRKLYVSDNRPWIIGLSGGKDSTCVTQMAYYMLLDLPQEKRKKELHIISADTLVESPLISQRITTLLSNIEKAAKKDHLPIKVKLLKPKLSDTFWVNLIGRGYPSPNKWFRWCTDRLKIRPATEYILNQVKENGEVILLLGARKSESISRSISMKKYEIKDFGLKKHSEIHEAFVYTPIEDLSHNNLWTYLLQIPPPWGGSNQELRTFYRKLDGECPLIIDKKAPSCGGSRFGCWTCTVVERDRAVEGLIEDGQTWLQPLLEFRNWLKKIRDDPSKRTSIRKSERKKKVIAEKLGKEFVQAEHRGHKILGPFTFETRHEILVKLINLQRQIKQMQNIELISPEELKAIEAIWIYDGDSISSLSDVIDTSKDFVDSVDRSPFEKNHINKTIFEKIMQKHKLPLPLVEKLLIAEKDLSKFSGRTGIYNRLENVIEEHMISTYLEKNK